MGGFNLSEHSTTTYICMQLVLVEIEAVALLYIDAIVTKVNIDLPFIMLHFTDII